MNRPPRPAGRAVARALRRHRRPVALLLLAAGAWSAVQAAVPAAPATRPVVVAARDLPSGAVLGVDDVTTVRLPPDLVPDGAAAPAAGAVLAAPVRRGEPFTDVRLAPAGGPRRPPGTVVVAVRTADPAAVLPVRPGDRVDVLAGPAADLTGAGLSDAGATAAAGGAGGGPGASGTGGGLAETLGRDLLVVAVPGRPGGSLDDATGNASADGGGTVADGAVAGAGGPGGLLDGMAGSGTASSAATVDLAGVVLVAADRATAARLAAVTGLRSLTVAVTSG